MDEPEEIEPEIDEALVAKLVEENMGWATAIAKSVARAWNLDWQIDGLDGGAYEGLLFCARRFNEERGVPFRAYARRRIHEAATEQARKSKSWQHGVGTNSEEEQASRDISYTLFTMFPELRNGVLPEAAEESGNKGDLARKAVRQLLMGASLVAAFQQSDQNPETTVEYKEMLEHMSGLDIVHQSILFAVYWKGQSMRNLATEWEVDELAVIREHKEILAYLSSLIEGKTTAKKKILKVRRGLRPVVQQLKRDNSPPPFKQFMEFGGKNG